MAIVIPAFAFALMSLAARLNGIGYRHTLVISSVIWGVLCALFTESLSQFHALTYWGVLGMWSAACAVAAVLAFRAWERGRALAADRKTVALRTVISTNEKAMIVAIVAIAVATGFLGVASAPSNWDSMTYHLPRVMHWIQNRSVEHFPCSFMPQLYHAPWAEFAILHLQILSGGDRFAFAVQWLAMVGSCVAVSLIASMMGAGIRGQVLSAVFVATLPAGILQAESTQNSYVSAYWLLAFVIAIFGLREGRERNWAGWSLLAGCSLALAILTKGTSYLFAVPLVLWATWVGLSAKGGMRALALIACLTLLLDSGHLARNVRCFGSPLLPKSEAIFYRTDAISPQLWASSLFRQLTLHFYFPNRSTAAHFQDLCRRTYSRLNMNPSDARITTPADRFNIHRYRIDEDMPGNPLHLVLISLAALGFAIHWIRSRSSTAGAEESSGDFLRSPGLLLALAIAAFGTFCAGTKWMPYNGRLDLPVFVLAAAPVGIALSRVRDQRVISAVAWAMLLLSIPILVANLNHPMFGKNSILRHSREDQYFVRRPELLAPYRNAVDLISKEAPQGRYGFAADAEWEYPIWVMLRTRLNRPVDIDAISYVPIPPGVQPPDPSKLSAIVVLDPRLVNDLMSRSDVRWRVKTFAMVTVLVREKSSN